MYIVHTRATHTRPMSGQVRWRIVVVLLASDFRGTTASLLDVLKSLHLRAQHRTVKPKGIDQKFGEHGKNFGRPTSSWTTGSSGLRVTSVFNITDAPVFNLAFQYEAETGRWLAVGRWLSLLNFRIARLLNSFANSPSVSLQCRHFLD